MREGRRKNTRASYSEVKLQFTIIPAGESLATPLHLKLGLQQTNPHGVTYVDFAYMLTSSLGPSETVILLPRSYNHHHP